jgi:Protein of unknown function (DUF2971)
MKSPNNKFRRVYHYLEAKWALEDIEKRRIRISRLNDLNDPFELLALELSSKSFRKKFIETKDELGQSTGLVCLSDSWQNPVMWSHYGDKHRGICLGFDVCSSLLIPITYELERLKIRERDFSDHNTSKQESAMRKCLSTKFKHWEYERERRLFSELDADCEEDGNYFFCFNSEVVLREIIVGPNSAITRKEIGDAIGNDKYKKTPKTFKSRLAFRSFKVVRQQDQSLWK